MNYESKIAELMSFGVDRDAASKIATLCVNSKIHEVKGRDATHTIEVIDHILTEEYYDARDMDLWEPESHTFDTFRTPQEALRWLKLKLKKPGWPNSTKWEIWRSLNGDSYSCYMI